MKNKIKLQIIRGKKQLPNWVLEALSVDFDLKVTQNTIDSLEWSRSEQPAAIFIEAFPFILNRGDLCFLLKSNLKTEHIPLFSLQGDDSGNDSSMELIQIPNDIKIKNWNQLIKQAIEKTKENLKKEILPNQITLLTQIPALIEKDEHILLTHTEAKILLTLVERPGELINRQALAEVLSHLLPKKTSLRSIDVHICSLRKKSNTLRKHLISVYGKGYQFSL